MTNPRLTVAFPRRSNGKTIIRALTSLDGMAKEAIPMLSDSLSEIGMVKLCEAYDINMPRKTVAMLEMLDDPETYGGFLPEKNAKGATVCTGAAINSSLSHVANELMRVATGDYVLFMNPGETCLDPLNIVRTLDFLDTQPQIDVVSCPVKSYRDGEHVKTYMAPKIFRRESKVSFTGVLADNWEPCNDLNWLISASGLTFMDHGDAWADSSAPDLYDLKLLLASEASRPWPEDDLGRAKAIVALTKIGQLLPKWNSKGALEILSRVIDRPGASGTEIVPALVARGQVYWRYESEIYDYEKAMEDLTRAIKLGGTAGAWIERGFLKHGVEGDWFADLLFGMNLAKATTTYGLDMRDYNLGRLILDAKPLADPKRCPESTNVSLLRGDRGHCLLDADGHRKHVAIDSGVRVTWHDM